MYCVVQIDIGNMYSFILSRNDPNQKPFAAGYQSMTSYQLLFILT
jgi:hypothetical protein